MVFARLGQVEHTRVRTHEQIGGMERTVEELAARLRYVDATKRRLFIVFFKFITTETHTYKPSSTIDKDLPWAEC